MSSLQATGCSAYLALKSYHGDATLVYVHFSDHGNWRRTFDDCGSSSKARRCRSFLEMYSRSAYRPAARLLLAESQFELWDFRSAVRTLRRLGHDYPRLHGYPDLLNSVSHYASDRPMEILRDAPDDSLLALWVVRRGRGA